MNSMSPVILFCVTYFAAGVLTLHWMGGFNTMSLVRREKRRVGKEDRGFPGLS